MIWLHVPGFDKPEKETRYGDGQVITDFTKWLVIDAFLGIGSKLMIAFLKLCKVKKPILLLTHAHCDHGNGILDIINDTYFSPEVFYCYDPESLRPGLRNNEGSKDVKDDIDYLYKLINAAKKRNIPVVYLKHGDEIKHGEIHFMVYREQPSVVADNDENGWAYVNDGSICLYFPELRYWTSGDGPEKIHDLVKAVKALVAVFEVSHHGNNCPRSQAEGMEADGAKICWYNDLEPDGIGTTDFTAYGARRCLQAGITVLDSIGDINALFYDGKGYWMHGGKVYPHDCDCKDNNVLRSGDAEVVQAVLSGAYGTMDARVTKLLIDGYDPMGVQELVNKTINGEIAKDGELRGVDVASYQRKFYPSKMKTTDFVITKMTQGIDYINPYADAQYGASKDFGKLLGAYHYAEGGDPVKEAAYFLKKVGGRVGSCILALDWEGKDNPTFGSGKDVEWCLSFLNEVYRQTGVRGFIYMSKSVTNKYDWSPVAKNYPLWGAQYGSDNRTNYQTDPWTDSAKWGAWGTPTIFQYSSHGSIAGYSGNIDINVAYLTREEWLQMAQGTSKQEEEPKQETTTEKYARETVVKLAQKYVGTKEGSSGHKALVDAYNNWGAKNGYPRGYKVKYTDAWCATFVSAIGILCGYTDIIPVECGCPQMITLAKNMGSWVENDAYIPTGGDIILYDWQDSGKGDNTGTPDHIGIVETVSGSSMKIIEGNYKDAVTRRSLAVNGRYIRGYIVPAYTAETAANTPVKAQEGTSEGTVDDVHKVAWTGIVATKHDPLNVRLGPGTEYKTCSFSPLAKGTKVGVCNHRIGKWLLIKYGSKYGYAHGDYIQRAT